MLASRAVLAPLLAAALLAATSPPGGAEPAEPPAGTAPVLETPPPARAPSGFLLPMPFWLPETKAGLALAAGRDFRVEGARRASHAIAIAAYSIERQGSVDASADVYLPRGSLVAARLRAVHYPDAYYGIGSAAPGSGHEDYTRRFVELAVSGELGLVAGRLRAGPRLAARAEELLDVVPG